MKRLRHPIRAIREPFGTAGLIIACLALVAALGGSAYAAASKLNTAQKKEVEKIARKYAGKAGATGTAGPAGAAGAAGKNGNDGAPGTGGPGSNGESVKITKLGGTKCDGGEGAEFSNASGSAKACDGTTGYTEFLPEGETEEGRVSIQAANAPPEFGGAAFGSQSISFVIPLESTPTLELVESAGEHEAECPGSAVAPKASEGYLCIYKETGFGEIDTEEEDIRAFSYGAFIILTPGSGSVLVPWIGSWAVTAE